MRGSDELMSVIAIVGAGLVGRAWAISFARGGHDVRLFDDSNATAAAARHFAAEALPLLESEGLLHEQTAAQVLSRISICNSLAAALDGAAHAQESTPERLDVKKAVFGAMDRIVGPDTVLASSTSAILPSAFTSALKSRHRCLVVHPINPPYLIPATEIVPAPWTAPEMVERTRTLLTGIGQAPIVMKREIDGFVMNRLQGALLEEAFRLVADGYASVEDVDVGIREGLALRWSFMGPFETIDLNAPGGIRDYVERYQQIYERLFPSMQRRVDWAGPVLEAAEADRRRKLPAAKLGERALWRDRRLMALLAHKRKTAKDIGN
jgi:L-gulonate 3-dehydrogenase